MRYPGCRFPGMDVIHNSRATRYLDRQGQQLIGQRGAAANWQRVWSIQRLVENRWRP